MWRLFSTSKVKEYTNEVGEIVYWHNTKNEEVARATCWIMSY